MNHPAVAEYDLTKTRKALHALSRHIAKFVDTLATCIDQAAGCGIPMATFGWYDIRRIVMYLQTTNRRIDKGLILSLMYNETFSDDAREKGKKQRFEFLHKMTRRRDGTDEHLTVYAMRATHGWGSNIGLDMNILCCAMPYRALDGIAAICHATKEVYLDDILKQRLDPMHRAGVMFTIFPHWDERSLWQQRHKAQDRDIILIFDKELLWEHCDGDLHYNPTGSIMIPRKIDTTACMLQIIQYVWDVHTGATNRRVIWDRRYQQLPSNRCWHTNENKRRFDGREDH